MFMKERLEVFCEGGILQMNNFRHTRGFRWPGLRSLRTLKQEKGHRQEIAACMKALRDGSPSPIPFEELLAVSRLSIDLAAD